MNYHSDLDIIFLYEADGQTVAGLEARRRKRTEEISPYASSAKTSLPRNLLRPPRIRPPVQTTTNQHFFSELGQRIIKARQPLDQLRPVVRGRRAASSDRQERHAGDHVRRVCAVFHRGGGQLWERQALCKARVVYGSPRAAKGALAAVAESAFTRRWRRSDAAEIRQMRQRLEESVAAAGDLKRGPGGIVDVEFLVQMLQLKHAHGNPQPPRAPTRWRRWPSCTGRACSRPTITKSSTRVTACCGTIEGRLRLMNSAARDQLPQDPVELAKLANLLHYPSSDGLLTDYENATRQIRAVRPHSRRGGRRQLTRYPSVL